MIEDIESIALDSEHPMNLMAKQVSDLIKKHQEYNQVINAHNIIKSNPDLLKRLISFLINPLVEKTEISAVSQPFAMEPFYATHRITSYNVCYTKLLRSK